MNARTCVWMRMKLTSNAKEGGPMLIFLAPPRKRGVANTGAAESKALA